MSDQKRARILLLGGTTEARAIAEVLAGRQDCETVMSLAGRTTFPASYRVPVRVGGFGGVDGLARHLREGGFDLLINATHPYASQMWVNAIEGTRKAGVPLIAIHRPAWSPQKGDKWIHAESIADAIAMLGRRRSRNVFLPLGRKDLVQFEAVPKHRYLVRAIEIFEPPLKLPNAIYLKARPPFAKADEIALMKKHEIELMIVKNSGGSASHAKLVAARELGIQVIVVARPFVPDIAYCKNVAEVLSATVHELGLRALRVA